MCEAARMPALNLQECGTNILHICNAYFVVQLIFKLFTYCRANM